MSDVGPSQEGENYEEDIFKVSPSYGGNPLPIPEEGEIGWGPTPTFEPWEETGWEADASQRLRISNNHQTATAMLEMTCVAVMGERTFSTGLHAWTVIIEVSRLNYGGAICIGVTDADPNQERRDNRGGWSCGFNPYCGAFFVTGDAYKVNYSTPAHNLMNGDLQGKANKAAVTVMVDMDQRQLAFSINGGPSVLATKAGGLPSTVRPWVHLFKEHDSVTITSPQGPSNAGTPGPPGPGEYVQGEDSFGGETHGAPKSQQLLPRSASGCSSFGKTSRDDALSSHPDQASATGGMGSSRSSDSSIPHSRSFGGSRSIPHSFGGSRDQDREGR